MSRAFVKEDDETAGAVPLPDRPISPHRNLVTRRGLRLIEERISFYEGELARATAAADREAIGRASRELRYWTARRATAEVAEPDTDTDRVVFGTAVTALREDDARMTFRIVGEDEADPTCGRIAWTAPVAQALLGCRPGTSGSCRPARSRSSPSTRRPKSPTNPSSFGRSEGRPAIQVEPLESTLRGRPSRKARTTSTISPENTR